jgi:glycosyltransferase involved in cell wall biosynthesis
MSNTVALSMIVRDAAEFLPACLASVRGLVDEMILADTGSQDATVSIAREAGARVVSVPWTNDFAAARNSALAYVSAEWVLSLDADEQLDDSAHRWLRPLLDKPAVAGYQVTIRNYVRSLTDRLWDRLATRNDSTLPAAAKYPAYVEHQNVRLFRRASTIYFIGRVHESVGPSIEQSGQFLGEANFLIHHMGLAADDSTQARKNICYRELGRQKIQDLPNNAQAHFELGLLEMDNFHNFAEAQALFARAHALDSRFGLAWFFDALSLVKLQCYGEALTKLEGAERCGYRSALVAETRGDAHYNLRNFAAARSSYSTAHRREPANASLQSKLGLAILRGGDRQRGLRELRLAVSANPSVPDVHDRLVLGLVWSGEIRDAAMAAEEKLASVAPSEPSDFLRAATLWTKTAEWATAARIVDRGLQVHPGDVVLLRAAREIAVGAQIPNLVNTAK